MRRAEQLPFEVIGPAVQRADDILRRAPAVQHDGLAVAAHVRQQLDLRLLVANEHAPFALAWQREIAPHLGDHEFVPDVAGALLEKCFDLALQKRFVKVSCDRQLTVDCVQLQSIAQIGHSHSREDVKAVNNPTIDNSI